MKNTFIAISLALFALFTSGCAGGGQTASARPPAPTQAAPQEQVASPALAPPPAPEPYFSGDGGKGMRLTVLEPSVNGLSADERRWMPLTIQGSITGDFNRYTDMTIIDRQNFERILAEQNLSMSGHFSDDDYIRIGHLTNTRYILWGNVTRTSSAYMLELGVTDAESGERKASYPPTQVTSQALENLTAVKEATADLLEQLGVSLTSRGRQELARPPEAAIVQAETSLARAITANRQGSIVEAMHYLSEAVSFDPQLTEANQRLSALTARINAGNLGENIRNDIQLRNAWLRLLDDATAFYRVHPLFNVVYCTEPRLGRVNYSNNTAELIFHWWLEANEAGVQSVYNITKALADTGKAEEWGLIGNAQLLLKTHPANDSDWNVHITFSRITLFDDKGLKLGEETNKSKNLVWYDGFTNGKFGELRSVLIQSGELKFTVNADRINDGMTLRFTDYSGRAADSYVIATDKTIVEYVRAQGRYSWNTWSEPTTFDGIRYIYTFR